MVRRTGDVFTIQFFLERGLLGQQRSFIYSSNDSTPDEWDGVDAKLAPNWYLSSSD